MGQWFQGSLLWAHKSPGHFRAENLLFCSCSAPWKIAFVGWRDTGISGQPRHTQETPCAGIYWSAHKLPSKSHHAFESKALPENRREGRKSLLKVIKAMNPASRAKVGCDPTGHSHPKLLLQSHKRPWPACASLQCQGKLSSTGRWTARHKWRATNEIFKEARKEQVSGQGLCSVQQPLQHKECVLRAGISTAS